MPKENGTPSAPSKADAKSGNVSGAVAQQMILKRGADAAKQAATAEHIEPEPVKAEVTPTTAPSKEELETAPPEKVEKPEVKVEKPEPEVDTPDDDLSHLSTEQRERIEKRIAKERAKRGDLEREIAHLRILANATPPAQQPVQHIERPDSPISGLLDPVEVQRRADEALEVKDWAQAQLDAEVSEAKLGGVSYDKQALRNAVRNADKFITRDAPKQLAFIQAKAQSDRQTAETFGSEQWMQDRTSEGYQAYLQILRDPDVAKRPQASWMAAIQVQGLLDVQRRRKAAGDKTAPVTTEPVKQKAPGSQIAQGGAFAPSREPGSSKAVAALQQEMEKLKGKKGVTGRDVEAYFQKMESVRLTR